MIPGIAFVLVLGNIHCKNTLRLLCGRSTPAFFRVQRRRCSSTQGIPMPKLFLLRKAVRIATAFVCFCECRLGDDGLCALRHQNQSLQSNVCVVFVCSTPETLLILPKHLRTRTYSTRSRYHARLARFFVSLVALKPFLV